MKKIYCLILCVLLIFFTFGQFVEVDAGSNNDELLRQYGCSLTFIMEHFGGELDANGNKIPTIEDWENGINDGGGDGVIYASDNTLSRDYYTGQYLSGNGLDVIQNWSTDPDEIFFSYDGLNRFFSPEDITADEILQFSEIIYMNNHPEYSGSTGGSGHSFTVITNSYAGRCYKLVGGGTSNQAIYESEDNGATWKLLK